MFAFLLVFVPLFFIPMTWLFNASRGSVLIPLILHSSYNTTIGAVNVPPEAEVAFRATGVAVMALVGVVA